MEIGELYQVIADWYKWLIAIPAVGIAWKFKTPIFDWIYQMLFAKRIKEQIEQSLPDERPRCQTCNGPMPAINKIKRKILMGEEIQFHHKCPKTNCVGEAFTSIRINDGI